MSIGLDELILALMRSCLWLFSSFLIPDLDRLEISSSLGLVLTLVSATEHLVVRLCFADHELLINLIPSYQQGSFLPGFLCTLENYIIYYVIYPVSWEAHATQNTKWSSLCHITKGGLWIFPPPENFQVTSAPADHSLTLKSVATFIIYDFVYVDILLCHINALWHKQYVLFLCF